MLEFIALSNGTFMRCGFPRRLRTWKCKHYIEIMYFTARKAAVHRGIGDVLGHLVLGSVRIHAYYLTAAIVQQYQWLDIVKQQHMNPRAQKHVRPDVTANLTRHFK